jgi:hypothetical protein
MNGLSSNKEWYLGAEISIVRLFLCLRQPVYYVYIKIRLYYFEHERLKYPEFVRTNIVSSVYTFCAPSV